MRNRGTIQSVSSSAYLRVILGGPSGYPCGAPSYLFPDSFLRRLAVPSSPALPNFAIKESVAMPKIAREWTLDCFTADI